MTPDELEREKRRLLDRISDHRQEMAGRTAAVRESLSPARTARSLMGGVLPLIRPAVTLLGARKRGGRGKLGKWLRVGLAATVLIPIVRSLLTDRDNR